jgi:hypothetical protein
MNRTRSNLIGALAFGLLALTPNAQYAQEAPAQTYAQIAPYSVGVEAGTLGFGGNLGWRFMDHLGVQTGFDYFDYTYNGAIKDNYFDAKLRLESAPLNLEVFPWKRSSFHISLGILFNQERLTGSVPGPTTINLGNGNTYQGGLSLDYKPEEVDPYVGIGGNIYFDKGHHFSLMGELGVAYAGNGTVNLVTTPTQPASAVAPELSKVQSYTRFLKYWPVIKLGFTYSF